MKMRRVIILLALILGAAVLAIWLAPRDPARARLEDYKRELIAKGEKLGKENWLPPPGRGSNGAPLLLRTLEEFSMRRMVSISPFALITTNRAEVMWREDFEEAKHEKPPMDVWGSIEEEFRTNRAAYSNIWISLHAEHLDFAFDYLSGRYPYSTNSSGILLGGVVPSALMSQIVMPLSSQALLRLHQNRPDEAFDELTALMELAQKTCNDPNFVNIKSRPKVIDNLFETTWQCLQYPNLDEARLRQLQTAWEGMDMLGAVNPAFALNRAFIEDRYKLERRNLSLWHKPARELCKTLAGLVTDFKSTTRTLRHNALEARLSFGKEAVEYTNAQALVEAARSLCRDHAAAMLINNLATPTRLEATTRLDATGALEGAATGETQRQMAIAAIALARYHLQKGRYPTNLAELQPAFLKAPPLDFMDGKPLRYKAGNDGLFLLYSVGLDGVDDGGKGWPKNGKKNLAPSLWDGFHDMVWPQPATDTDMAARKAAVQEARTHAQAH